MRRRLFWLFGPLCSAFALTLVLLPTVQRDPAPPRTEVGRVGLATASDTVQPGWGVEVATDTNLVGVQWQGDRGAQFTVEKRDRHGQWSAAGTAAAPDGGPDPSSAEARHQRAATGPGTTVSDPVWVGDATAVRVRLTGGRAHAVDLRTVRATKATAPNGLAGALPPAPGIVPRAGWGADESLRLGACPQGPQYDSKVRFAVVHHTDNSNNYSPAETPQLLRSIYAYHVVARGLCDIAYSFLIDRYGQVFEGRFGGTGQAVHGAHAIGFNTDSTGVALVGTFQDVAPPPAAIAALEQLLAFKLAFHGVDPAQPLVYVTSGNDKFPAGTPVFMPPIVGHRDTWFTDCPGQQAWNLLPAIRANVVARVWSGPPDVFPFWQPQAGKPKLMALSGFGSLYPAGGQPWLGLAGYWPGWDIARDVELLPGGTGGYVLDGFGGIHPFGAAPPLSGLPYFRFDIARDLVLLPGGTSGYELDGWGGIHPFGGAPPLTGGPYWPGWDIAHRMQLAPGGGYVLDGWGGVHTVGGAASPGAGPYWPGWDIARDLVVRAGSPGVYVLDGFGGIHALGGAPVLAGVPYFGFDNARGLALLAGGVGGYVLDAGGVITAFGGATPVAQAGPIFPHVARALSAVP
jgi:hypothetical protein